MLVGKKYLVIRMKTTLDLGQACSEPYSFKLWVGASRGCLVAR